MLNRKKGKKKGGEEEKGTKERMRNKTAWLPKLDDLIG